MKEIEGNSSTDASGTNVNLAMQMEFSYANSTERVTGRKARGLQTEERGCKCQTFFSLLSGRRKQTSDMSFLLCTHLKGGFS